MDYKKILKSMLPFTIGALAGAGFTKNKYVYIILISYFVLIVLIHLFSAGVDRIIKSKDKKETSKALGVGIMDNAYDLTYRGHVAGAKIFDKHYSGYSIMFNTFVSVYMIVLLFQKNWLLAFIMFIVVNFFIIQNQILRTTRENKGVNNYENAEIKEHDESNEGTERRTEPVQTVLGEKDGGSNSRPTSNAEESGLRDVPESN